jgi:eukaryotic-like serine/threonine-protein kinase
MIRLDRALLVLVAALACAGCSDGRERAATELDGSPPVAAGIPGDDWTTFAHDERRSGYQPQSTGITPANVASLVLRWRYETGAALQASPLVAGGRVYVALSSGTVVVLDARTGTLIWKRATGATIAMTPALAQGMLFVGDHRAPGNFMALDAGTGKTIWQTPFAGGVRSEPVIENGIVYEGETGGDAPPCRRSGLHALDERTGKPLWTWLVDRRPHDGGSVWSPLSFDRGLVIFGTGNSCENGNAFSNAVVALDAAGRVAWFFDTAKSGRDSDVGGGTLILHGQALATSKNGNLYDIEDGPGTVNWTSPLGSAKGYGGIGTPSTDGKTIVASRGYTADPTVAGSRPPGGALLGFDTAGTLLWTVPTDYPIPGSAAISNGIAYTPLDRAFVALDLQTGTKLWSYADDTLAYPSPAVVPSGVYFADDGGRIFAFALPKGHS